MAPLELAKSMPEPSMITVVSGLPRSGTSLMMQMLAAGGWSDAYEGCSACNEGQSKRRDSRRSWKTRWSSE